MDVVLGWDSNDQLYEGVGTDLPVGTRVTPMLPFKVSYRTVVATFRLNLECYFSSASSTCTARITSAPEI